MTRDATTTADLAQARAAADLARATRVWTERQADGSAWLVVERDGRPIAQARLPR